MEDEYIAGRRPIIEALRAGRTVNKIILARGNRHGLDDLLAMAHNRRVPVNEVDPAALQRLAGGPGHQGVVALMAPRSYADVDEILARAAEKGQPPFIVMLDGVEDPRNLGAIIRTAEAAGAHGIVIPERRAAGVTSVTVKASAGATEFLPIARVANLNRTIEQLKEKGLWVAGADLDGQDYRQADLKGPVLLVIGGEGQGLSHMVREHCDFVVGIPMRGQVGSLNASVAAALLIYEILRRRDA